MVQTVASTYRWDLIAYNQGIVDKRGRSTVKVATSEDMLLMRWLDMVVYGGKIRMDMKQLIELRVKDGEDSLNTSWMPEDVFKIPPAFGTPSLVSCIGPSLQLLEDSCEQRWKGRHCS